MSMFLVDMLEINTISMVLDRHGYGVGSGDTRIRCPELQKLLSDLYNLCRKSAPSINGNINADTSAELLLNFMLNLYDKWVWFSMIIS